MYKSHAKIISAIQYDNVEEFKSALGIRSIDTSLFASYFRQHNNDIDWMAYDTVATPLWYAASFGSINIMKYTIEKGANVNFIGHDEPILHRVCNNYEATKLLLENGATPNLAVEYMIPLLGAVEEYNIKVFDLLIEYGANVNIETPEGDNIISLITSMLLMTKRYPQSERMFRHILSNYTIFHSVSKTKALKYAKRYGDEEIISLLEFQSLKFIAYGSMVKNSVEVSTLFNTQL